MTIDDKTLQEIERLEKCIESVKAAARAMRRFYPVAFKNCYVPIYYSEAMESIENAALDLPEHLPAILSRVRAAEEMEKALKEIAEWEPAKGDSWVALGCVQRLARAALARSKGGE
jgi:hypothetical protein